VSEYRGRLAPTPTGYLHAGHAATFGTAHQRAVERAGMIVFRMEDLDPARCKPEFVDAALEDLSWLGFRWQEGPFYQSQRTGQYLAAWRILNELGVIYPCTKSRKDVESAPFAPHEEEKLFPMEWRPSIGFGRDFEKPDGFNWRFRVPDGRRVTFTDGRCGDFARMAGTEFGDFVVWRRDGVPAYELAVVVDDVAMDITEVVRGEDLLVSTCRQLLIYEALAARAPAFYHCPLVRDAKGERLAKRAGALSIRALRDAGVPPTDVLAGTPASRAISSSI